MPGFWLLLVADLTGGTLVEQVLRPDLYPEGVADWRRRREGGRTPPVRPVWPTREAAEAELARVAGFPVWRNKTDHSEESDHFIIVRGTGPARRYRALRYEISAP